MNSGKYRFSQITDFLPKRCFERVVMSQCNDRTQRYSSTYWNQMLVLVFGQLDGCNSLLELTDNTTSHATKSSYSMGNNTLLTRSLWTSACPFLTEHDSEASKYTQLDIVTKIPVSFNITEAVVHNVNAMTWINYEPLACYVSARQIKVMSMNNTNFIID